MSTVAIIPARGGSKGVPGKNIKVIDGKPLINYTIETALKSDLIDFVIVSSDCVNILSVVKDFGELLIHKREQEIASDNSPISETIYSILNEFEHLDIETIVLLQPTSPIRETYQVDEAISTFLKGERNSLISVCEMDDIHPARMYWKKDGVLDPIMPSLEQKRRQEIPKALYRNGSMYITSKKTFVINGNLMEKPSLGYIMPFSQLLNIDEPRDIIIADALIKAWKEGEL